MGNVKDQVYIQQGYLTQVITKLDNLENMLIYFQILLILLFIAFDHTFQFSQKLLLLLCGDIEKKS